MYNIILFDLDGTLTDSKEAIIKSAEYALRQVGIEKIDYQKLHEMLIGPPLEESFQTSYGLNEAQTFQAIKYYQKRYEKYGIHESKLYNGIKEMVKKLFQEGKILYIATSRLTYLAQKIIQHFRLTEYFTEIVGASLDYARSIKVDMIDVIIKKHPQHPSHSFIMVGDKASDILAANEHGIDSIAVTYGYGTIDELQKANPTHTAHSVKELGKILLIDNNQTSLL